METFQPKLTFFYISFLFFAFMFFNYIAIHCDLQHVLLTEKKIE